MVSTGDKLITINDNIPSNTSLLLSFGNQSMRIATYNVYQLVFAQNTNINTLYCSIYIDIDGFEHREMSGTFTGTATIICDGIGIKPL